MHNLIEARRIALQFPTAPMPLFSKIDIFLTAGVQALIGHNGSGKSCLAAITLHDYRGALVVVSHDRHFLAALGHVTYLYL